VHLGGIVEVLHADHNFVAAFLNDVMVAHKTNAVNQRHCLGSDAVAADDLDVDHCIHQLHWLAQVHIINSSTMVSDSQMVKSVLVHVSNAIADYFNRFYTFYWKMEIIVFAV
jgi:hypothetical protein